jgi:hypothetical protein
MVRRGARPQQRVAILPALSARDNTYTFEHPSDDERDAGVAMASKFTHPLLTDARRTCSARCRTASFGAHESVNDCTGIRSYSPRAQSRIRDNRSPRRLSDLSNTGPS